MVLPRTTTPSPGTSSQMSAGGTSMLVAGAASTIALSLVFQMYVLATLGAGIQSDAFYAASALPLFMNAVFCDPLAFVIVPLLAKCRPNTFWKDAWTIIHGITALFALIAVGVYLIIPFVTPLILPGFGSTGLALATEMSTILILGTFFAAIGIGARSVAHASGSFLWPTLCSVLGSLVGLVWLFWSFPRIGIVAGAWGMTLRMGVETALLLAGLRAYTLPDPRSAVFHGIFAATWPLWVGNLYFRSDIVLDRALSSMAPPGAMSVFLLAQQALGGITQVLNRGAAAPLLPQLSRLARDTEWVHFTKTYSAYSQRLFLCLVGLLMTVLLIGKHILTISFQFSHVSASDVVLLWILLLLLAGLLLGDPISYVCSSAFYALGNTRTPTRIAAAAFTLSVVLKLGGFRVAGIYGLALATSGSYLVRMWLLARALHSAITEERLQTACDRSVAANGMRSYGVALNQH